ncbi:MULTISPECIES: GAF domain-containing protein [unclassified Microcoleus]|uniref:GAF domain-containing protein n=1 Tax=unclassified Microcoleus TaxID=2642155 RepID=UPI001D910DB5|nr:MULTISPECIES: GAF domain-containing protein [unclassified Microcoleus]MCC3441816.1 GAF domain-containing protein [Microcoleus sp. PH2017_03_ELD_O_A]TAE09275.1 MAG: GAF domain-containing protein [Oscillatoriales cyanobacterium]MCC3411414.1 GAF domain-containing protein [Microcoleus sp. PH2017_02_FOX_O_A]MCC3436485.1 GAF domain-containing protein [Microcoleus sp. PH2017_05_CCC_O_A]MCC3494772.1 GAF domain-containing protein [Microcoleus sp. PH2017_16_JOR_D_A]
MPTPKSSSSQNNNNSVKSLPTADPDIIATEQDSENLPNEPDVEQLLEALTAQVPTQSAEIERLKTWKQDLERLFQFLGDRRVLIAVMEPGTFALRYANAAFCRLAGWEGTPLVTQSHNGWFTETGICLLELFEDCDAKIVEQLYRRHLLHWVFKQFYEISLDGLRVLDEPVTVSIKNPQQDESRFIEFWLGSEQLKITQINSKKDEFADLPLNLMPVAEREAWLMQPNQLGSLADRLNLDNYRIEGLLLLEGFDVTVQEQIRRLTQLLIDRDSMLRPDKFERIDRYLRSLFNADGTLLLRPDGEQVQLLVAKDGHHLQPVAYSMESLETSHFFKATAANQVWNVPDLRRECRTECERTLRKMGAQSMLLVPLVVKSVTREGCGLRILGVVGLLCDRPNHFNNIDAQHAQELIPAFIAALRQAIQQRFTHIHNIHPAVEWRFAQEAERRSWGLPQETIVFADVHPLYGISDIRGSSDERNRAIQTDLLEQFRLGLAIADAVCKTQTTHLGEQLRLDLLDYIEHLKEKVTVDMEVRAAEYLNERLEVYFDYFVQCSPTVQAAVEAYQAACDNEHNCVYGDRNRYDQMLNLISTKLQETWTRWQEKMQQILPHYCDIECTDGMDHMIYVGKAIDPKFSQFHLHSLRYEQLRAICDCGRTVFRLQAESQINMELAHLVLVQNTTIDIFHNENTEKMFDVKGTRDIRYELVKKRIEKAVDKDAQERITQSGMLTVVYSTEDEWEEYQQYLRYLSREGWVEAKVQTGMVESLQGVSGLKFARVRILPEPESIVHISEVTVVQD